MAFISKRLRLLVDVVGDGKASHFAKKCGITVSVFSQYLRGNSLPGAGQLAKILLFARCDANWLLLGEGEPFPKTTPVIIEANGDGYQETLAAIPIIPHAKLLNKGPAFSENKISQRFFIAKSALTGPAADHVAIKMPDMGMVPILLPSDFIVINLRNTNPKDLNHKIVAVVHDGKIIIRSMSVHGNRGILMPYNIEMPPICIEDLDSFRGIIGSVELRTTVFRHSLHNMLSK